MMFKEQSKRAHFSKLIKDKDYNVMEYVDIPTRAKAAFNRKPYYQTYKERYESKVK